MKSSKPVKKKGKQALVNQDKKLVDSNIDRSYPGLSKIDIIKALKLRLKNKLTYQEIADQLGCSKQAVQQRLQKFISLTSDPQAIQAYEECKPELLSAVENELLSKLLDQDKLEKANLNNVAYAFTQIHTANRLERGKSTTITDDVDSIIDRIERRYACAIDITPSSNDSN